VRMSTARLGDAEGMYDFAGKVALVMGAACPPEIGRAVAVRLAQAGADVACADWVNEAVEHRIVLLVGLDVGAKARRGDQIAPGVNSDAHSSEGRRGQSKRSLSG